MTNLEFSDLATIVGGNDNTVKLVNDENDQLNFFEDGNWTKPAFSLHAAGMGGDKPTTVTLKPGMTYHVMRGEPEA